MAQETRAAKITRIENELTDVRASIAKSLKSQSLNVFGRSVTRPDLEKLYKREKYLESKLENLYNLQNKIGQKNVRFRY